MDTFSIKRTSRDSAECEPVVLRETDQRRLVFKAVLLNNPNAPDECVDGSFVYQRKRKKGKWKDHNELKLTQLRADEWIRLKLSAEELYVFLRHMAALYRHHDQHGLPRQKIHLLKVDLEADDVEEMEKLDFRRVLTLSRKAGFDVVAQFLEWIARLDNSEAVLNRLEQLDLADLERLGDLARLQGFRRVLREWEDQLSSADEEYWQENLDKYAFVLGQLVAYPILVIRGRAYVGGKGIDNRGGHVADYLARNPVTKNAVVVELKTPMTPLLDTTEYRDGVFAPSGELLGATSQVLTYRHSLCQKYDSLIVESTEDFTVFRPPCVVVAGNAKKDLGSPARVRSFELFRAELKDVTVLTFDELVEQLRQVVEALQTEVPV